MKRFLFVIVLGVLLTACGNTDEEETTQAEEELKSISVDFELPEEAEVGETVTLVSTVTYGEDELVTDAQEMNYEYWHVEDEENTVTVESTNNEDGTYSAEVVFEQPGTYEIYAHTTAKDIHSMPLESITINGEASDTHEEAATHEHEDGEHEHANDFEIAVEEPTDVSVNEEVALTSELSLDGSAYEGARVRYEIIPEGSENHEWVEAEETEQGIYQATHTFTEAVHHDIVVHVNGDNDLHEHTEFMVHVNE
ncbi:FixH family protein [Gracilibacillus timonensis]|uniref:FixH family protein n=1 Tax=Gracilibacillus timonensis TaxID=1816696 RepID=UPI000824B5FB|nr:FixH family protein [Gracilibacillus timonensis]